MAYDRNILIFSGIIRNTLTALVKVFRFLYIKISGIIRIYRQVAPQAVRKTNKLCLMDIPRPKVTKLACHLKRNHFSDIFSVSSWKWHIFNVAKRWIKLNRVATRNWQLTVLIPRFFAFWGDHIWEYLRSSAWRFPAEREEIKEDIICQLASLQRQNVFHFYEFFDTPS